MVVGQLGQWGEVMGFLNLAVRGKVAIRGPGRDGLLINRWRGYISFARVLLGQACGLLYRPEERTDEHPSPL